MTRFNLICVVAIVSKFLLLLWVAFMRSKHKTTDLYYFAYCDGSMRHVVSKDIVPKDMFMSYDTYVAYPVMHIAKDTIYFQID